MRWRPVAPLGKILQICGRIFVISDHFHRSRAPLNKRHYLGTSLILWFDQSDVDCREAIISLQVPRYVATIGASSYLGRAGN